MIDFNSAIEYFIHAIKSTDNYCNYMIQKEKLEQYPDLKEKIDEFRQRNYELQNNSSGEELFDKVDEFEKEYEALREDPIVEGFLTAELNFCRMMQETNWKITEALEFD